VLERRAQVGGAASRKNYIRFPLLDARAQYGPLRADIVRDMQLERHGLKLTTPMWYRFSAAGRRALVLYSDAKKAAQEIAQCRRKMRPRTRLCLALGKIGKVIGEALALTPPNIDTQQRRSLGNAENGPVDSQSGQERSVSRAALGSDGRRDLVPSSSTPNRCAPPSRPRHLWNIPGPWSRAPRWC